MMSLNCLLKINERHENLGIICHDRRVGQLFCPTIVKTCNLKVINGSLKYCPSLRTHRHLFTSPSTRWNIPKTWIINDFLTSHGALVLLLASIRRMRSKTETALSLEINATLSEHIPGARRVEASWWNRVDWKLHFFDSFLTFSMNDHNSGVSMTSNLRPLYVKMLPVAFILVY